MTERASPDPGGGPRNHTSWMEAAQRGRPAAPSSATAGCAGSRGTAERRQLPFPRRAAAARGSTRSSPGRAARGGGRIGCWATGLEPTEELAARLVARGFEWGWQPHWMALELGGIAARGAPMTRVALVTEVPEYDSASAGRCWR